MYQYDSTNNELYIFSIKSRKFETLVYISLSQNSSYHKCSSSCFVLLYLSPWCHMSNTDIFPPYISLSKLLRKIEHYINTLPVNLYMDIFLSCLIK